MANTIDVRGMPEEDVAVLRQIAELLKQRARKKKHPQEEGEDLVSYFAHRRKEIGSLGCSVKELIEEGRKL